uniref:Uncharacterized protein n=1 Tax=Graphocephala atropunctata TaxID=36148 RepID=A0A1B6MK89_9HEMI
MAATLKQTTNLIVVFLAVHAVSAELHINWRFQPATKTANDQKKPREHLDQVKRRHQTVQAYREVEPPIEKQPQFSELNKNIETSKLWQNLKSQVEVERRWREARMQAEPSQNQHNGGRHQKRNKREAPENQQKRQPKDQRFRFKREVVIHPQLKPEVVMQPMIQMAMEKETEEKRPNLRPKFHLYNQNIYHPDFIDSFLANRSRPYQEKLSQHREKRQILYLLDGKTPLLFRPPRTTPNPFIRQTNLEDYEVVQPRLGEEFRQVPGDDADSSVVDSSYQLSEIRKALNEINKQYLNRQSGQLETGTGSLSRIKRSPKMSKLKKKQKLAKKKRKKKKQQKLSPRQIKHYRRIREHREERRKILHKRLKEKRRLRHKKLGTGPYNKTIIDYYGVYFDPPSSQLNDSLYDSIYDSSALDSEKLYDEAMKDYPDSGVEGEEYEDSDEEEEEDENRESEDEDNDGDKGDGTKTGNESEKPVGNKDKDVKNKNQSKMNKQLVNNKKKNSQTVGKNSLIAQEGKGNNIRNNKNVNKSNNLNTKLGTTSLKSNKVRYKPKILKNKNTHNIINENIKPKNIKYNNFNSNELPYIVDYTSHIKNADLINIIFDNEPSFTNHHNSHGLSEIVNPILTSRNLKQNLNSEKLEPIIPILQPNSYRIL